MTLALLGTLALILVWEAAAPFRALAPERSARWRVNILLYVIGAALLSLLAPLSLAAVARWAADRGWGPFNWLVLPAWLVVALSVLAMDETPMAQQGGRACVGRARGSLALVCDANRRAAEYDRYVPSTTILARCPEHVAWCRPHRCPPAR